MRTLRVGIATYEQMKARTLAAVNGEIVPAADDPKVWFTTVESFARVLSPANRHLLGLIASAKPDSLANLGELSGRAVSNLSRTLRTMERYGLVELAKGRSGKIVPRLRYDLIELELPLTSSAAQAGKAAA
jgi:predicted transcriptional regulator